MLIDFHTHIFPPKIAPKTIEVLEESIVRVSHKTVKAVIGATSDDLLKSMKDNNVDFSVVLPIATNVHQHTTINNYAAEVNKIPGIFSFGSLHPMQEDWCETLYDIKEKGLLGIKLHPEYQQFFIDSPESVRLLKKCEELGLMVVLHTGKDHGIEPPVHCTPDRLRFVLDNHVSGKNIVAGHLGGWQMWDEVEKYLIGTPVLLDTAYISQHISSEQFVRIVQTHGSDKVLFATDSPWESPAHTKAFIDACTLSESEKNNIFSENAKKLLKIS